ncbi:MAG: hypothetical protein OXF08_03915 [Bacteroidetes bacterium]|nr:hypothetical protein [Bacteroidota bacterium]
MSDNQVRQKLLSVAEIIANAQTHPATLQPPLHKDIEPLVQRGLVKIEFDKISFSSDELLATWIPQYCAIQISNEWSDLNVTARKFLRAYDLFRKLGLTEKSIAVLFLSIEKDCSKNILIRLEEAALLMIKDPQSELPLSSIYLKFCSVIPQLDYTSIDLVNHLGPVLEAKEDYLFPRELYESIERWASQSQEKAESLLSTCLEQPQNRTVELATYALISLSKFDHESAHRKAIELTKKERLSLQRVGTMALSRFSYDIQVHEKKISDTINRFEELCHNNDEILLSTLCRAYVFLLYNLPESKHLVRVQERLFYLASLKKIKIQHVLSKVLFHHSNKFGDSDWFWNVTDHLADIPADHKFILDELDWAMYSLAKTYPERVLRFIENVVLSESYGDINQINSLPNLYKHTLTQLIDKHLSVLESKMTRWFASKSSRLHFAAADLVKYFMTENSIQCDNKILFDSSELNQLDEGDIERLIFAIIGYVEDYNALTSLLISVLSRKEVSNHICEMIVSILEHVILYNKPSLGRKYLRDLIENSDISGSTRQSITDAIGRSDSYYNFLGGRPNLKEFIPPPNRAHRFYVERQKMINRLHQENMFNDSRLLSLIPTIPVKYGRASFSSDDTGKSSKVSFNTIRSEYEIPRELIINPLRHQIKRINWRFMAVNGNPLNSSSSANENSEKN